MKCRGCGGGEFDDVVDLGLMPLVNNLLQTRDEACRKWPLKVVRCVHCTLAQLTETPAPSAMFDEYLYFSSQSQTMVNHAHRLVQQFVRPGDRVVEIASNDGYLLKPAQQFGATVLGVDPAKNIAEFANAQGINTRCEYFGVESAKRIVDEWGQADVMFANNVLAHVPDPNEIARGIKVLLAEGGRAHIECPWLVRMIEGCAFDTIYHEHQCYFSVTALQGIFNRAGLKIIDAQEIEIHGGSVHIVAAHNGDESSAAKMMETECQVGVNLPRYYERFRQRIDEIRTRLLTMIEPAQSVGAFGAAAKGIILLNHFGLMHDRIEWVADVSPHKQGRFVPGAGQRVVSPEVLVDEMPEICLLLPWNLKEEIVRRNAAYIQRGGKFVVPLPKVELVEHL
ncbi:MAG TPA: class I SAM-dependent methyltransferase [Phycisphaerales bacterium]|nr:class I SAM-dependent methyltransferase [Phycisphaerales bacterium]